MMNSRTRLHAVAALAALLALPLGAEVEIDMVLALPD